MNNKDNKITESIKVLPSDVDYASTLSYPDIFALFQNIAVDHSVLLGYDQSVLTPKGLFWVMTKNKISITDRPGQGEMIEVSTWPEKPDRIRGRRNFTIEKDGKLIIEATTEWAVVDRNTNRLYMISNLYDPDFKFYPETVLPEPFHRFSFDFEEELFAEYTVRSIDIDFEGHMNNVAYIRALFGLFSRKEIEDMAIHEFECQFRVSCFEGDKLLWYKKQTEEGLEICAKLKDNTVIFLAKIR